jgi:hypothetical protein
MMKNLESNDPFELVGVTYPGEISEETDRETGRCIVEEYALTGFAAEEILALFSSPMYELPHAIFRRRGRGFVAAMIGEVFGGAR